MLSSPEYVSGGAGQEIDALDDVEKDLVLPVLDAVAPPGDSVGHRRRRFHGHLQFIPFL